MPIEAKISDKVPELAFKRVSFAPPRDELEISAGTSATLAAASLHDHFNATAWCSDEVFRAKQKVKKMHCLWA